MGNDDLNDYQQLALDSVIVSEKLCASLKIPAGARVLDIGCGTGHTAIAAARRRAVVTGIDLNERSLARARLRAEAEGLGSVEFLTMDANAMRFPDASFGYALSTLGVVFLPDNERAARELARIVKVGGGIALTSYTRQSLPGQIYDLVNSLYRNPTMPAVPYYAWSEAPLAGELLGPYFCNIRIRLDSFDTCFPSSTAMFDRHLDMEPTH
jgi:ubiquinone/menaquinone biosynthesis C-methylase UbiE